MTQHVCDEVVLRRSSRRGNAVSRNDFSCEVHVCKNFGGGNLPVPGCGPGLKWLWSQM